jgi:glycerol 3-phosphatase-2
VGRHHDNRSGSGRAGPGDLVSPQDGGTEPVETVICDLDGVVWLEGEPIGESVAAVRAWRSMGCRVLFVTNNSMVSSADHAARLSAMGIEAAGDVVSSSDAVASILAPGESVMVLGGSGLIDTVADTGAVVVDPDIWSASHSMSLQPVDGSHTADGPVTDHTVTVDTVDTVDTVVVGLDRRFDYPRLSAAVTALRSGARFVAANDDPLLPTPAGPMPGAGSMVAAVARASGHSPIICGKPHPPIITAIRKRLGPAFDPTRTVVVGDRLMTDGLLAARLGCRFALIGNDGTVRWRRDTDDDAPVDVAYGGDRSVVVDVDVDAIDDPTRVEIWCAADTLHEVMVACRLGASE